MVDYNDLSLDELAALRRQMAQTVNRQMRRFEKSVGKKRAALSQIAEPYLRRQGRKRFSEAKAPMARKNEAQQRRAELAEINAIQRYREAKTYYISGYKEANRKAAEGFAKSAGEEVSVDIAEALLESEAWGWLKRTIKSEGMQALARNIAAGNATKAEAKNRMMAVYKEYIDRERDWADMAIEEKYSALGLSFNPEYLKQRR